jgi:tRNA(Ile2)-agmatinylcytidine synthase
MILNIGLDDTDSDLGGCTTYIAALVVERLASRVEFLDYPLLVRLNPNIPWKTRGNAALCLRIGLKPELLSNVEEEVAATVEEHAELGVKRTDPGIVFLQGEVHREVVDFGSRCVREVVSKGEALRLIRKHGGEALCYGRGRGIIGALGAIGNLLEGDHTYELLAYRTPEKRGMPRRLEPLSVMKMDEATRGLTFNNVDPETGRILITPRGPDPVLLGIRGETPSALIDAFRYLEIHEDVERWVIFKTNQGTDAHLQLGEEPTSIRPYRPVAIAGTVSRSPRAIVGGHVFFYVKHGPGEISCAAYEPTGGLRSAVMRLEVGDRVRVYGGVRPARGNRPVTVNIEKLEVLELAPKMVYVNPLCPDCGKRMESMGKGKGYRCRRCGLRARDLEPEPVKCPRDLDVGLYLPPPRAQRHLTKPLSRYGVKQPPSPSRPEGFWGVGAPV